MEYATRYLQAKENVLREVLTQYLGRTPTLDDARKVENWSVPRWKKL